MTWTSGQMLGAKGHHAECGDKDLLAVLVLNGDAHDSWQSICAVAIVYSEFSIGLSLMIFQMISNDTLLNASHDFIDIDRYGRQYEWSVPPSLWSLFGLSLTHFWCHAQMRPSHLYSGNCHGWLGRGQVFFGHATRPNLKWHLFLHPFQGAE